MLRINASLTAGPANHYAGAAFGALNKTIAQIASGLRINQASDDASGLAMATEFTSQLNSDNQGISNAQAGVSMLQTADSGLGQTTDLLQRARDLSVQAGNGTLTASDRQNINDELTQITQQIDSISSNTQFNTKNLLDGSQNNVSIQTGANQAVTFSLPNASSTSLGVNALDANNATASLQAIDNALSQLGKNRSDIGASVNGLTQHIDVQQVAAENMAAANSRIQDTDMATAASALATNTIMAQASLAMSAQANIYSSGVVSLLE